MFDGEVLGLTPRILQNTRPKLFFFKKNNKSRILVSCIIHNYNKYKQAVCMT